MTPAEKRIKELIDRWLTSVELHLQYTDLPDEAYWKVQAWPKHDRPTRWVLESAKQKANELKEVFDSRHGMGDSKFAEALELMQFLANLVGAQHVDRFVPLAEPKTEAAMPKQVQRAATAAPPSSDVPNWYAQAHAAQAKEPATHPAMQKPARTVTPAKPESPRKPPNDPEATREMPRRPSEDPDATREMARRPSADSDATREMPKVRNQPAAASPKSDSRKAPPSRPAAQPATSKQGATKAAAPNEVQLTVITDAVRLLGWGRTWHELAELIARMADRPSLGEVRKILRTHRAAIEKASKA